MATDRCPGCGASVRAGDPWCTLCWTDLRPAPPPPPPAPAPAPVAPPGSVPVGQLAVVDPLTAPLPVLLGEAPAAAQSPTWPCVECGEPNAIELDACRVCTTPFGGRLTRLDDPKGERRRRLLMAIGVVMTFLVVLAVMTFAMTDPGGVADAPSLDPVIDYSTLPQE